jgi:hypothetical protein
MSQMSKLRETRMDDLATPLLDGAAVPSAITIQSSKPFWLSQLVRRARLIWHDCCDWLYWKFQRLFKETRISKPKEELALKGLRQLSERSFDWNDPEQQQQLQLTWFVGFPGEEFPEQLKSNRWKDMGWQSDDPSRDFRGAGALALQLLSGFAQVCPDEFLDLMWKRRGERSDWEYPFAAAGVNLAYVLIGLLQLRGNGGQSTPATHGFLRLVMNESIANSDARCGIGEPSEKVILTIFTEMYLDLDRIWLRTGASYMDFPRVLSEVRNRTARALGRWWISSLEDYKTVLLAM